MEISYIPAGPEPEYLPERESLLPSTEGKSRFGQQKSRFGQRKSLMYPEPPPRPVPLPLEKKLNYLNLPGAHSLLSPVVGSSRKKFERLMEEAKTNPAYMEFEKAIYQPSFVYLLENDIESRNRADEIARKWFENNLAPFKKYALTLANVVDWTNDCPPGPGTNKTWLSDIQNEWNAWNVRSYVNKRNDTKAECNSKDNNYLPPYIVAEHEFHHVQEIRPRMSEKERNQERGISELMPTLNTLLELDQIYKQMHHDPLEQGIEYKKYVATLSGQKLDLGKVLAFYQKILKEKNGDIYEALLSKPSREFLDKFFSKHKH